MSSSSSAPPILPLSSHQVPSAAAGGDPQIPVVVVAATPALRAFFNHLSESLKQGMSQRRPWAELTDRSAFSKPESVSDAALRLRKNYAYFRINYLSGVAAVLGLSLLSHPLSLILLVALLASWLFLYLFRPSDAPLLLFGRTFNDRETLGVLIVLTVVVVFLTSVGSVLISALMVGLALVCAHGSFRVPEDLFLDDQEASPASGFLSFLGGAASNAAAVAAAAPAVQARI